MRKLSEKQLKNELSRLKERKVAGLDNIRSFTLSEEASLEGSIMTVKKLIKMCKEETNGYR